MRLLVVLCLLVGVQGKGWWMEQPYANDDFNIRVEYGEDINITCEDPRLEGDDYTVKYWVIPDMTMMYSGDYIDFKTLDGQAGWQVNADNSSIRLFIITENHFGFYYCLVEDSNGDQTMVKRAVNYKGPFFDDLWDDYRMNTIVAFSSSIAFLAIVGSLYGVNVFYEKRKGKSTVSPSEDGDEDDDDDDTKKKIDQMEGQTGKGYDNDDDSTTEEMRDKVAVVDQQPSGEGEATTNV